MEKVHISQQESQQIALTNGVLTSGAAFVSGIVNTRGFSNIYGFAFSDVASATGGLIIQQAADIGDFDITSPFALSAGSQTALTIAAGDITANGFSLEVVAPFARIVYTNGGTAQTTFRLWVGARFSSW